MAATKTLVRIPGGRAQASAFICLQGDSSVELALRTTEVNVPGQALWEGVGRWTGDRGEPIGQFKFR